MLQKETKASTVNCSLGEFEPNKRKISRFRKFQKLIQNLFKDGLVTHRFGQIQSDSWDNGLFNYSLFGLKSRLVMLDFRAIFGKIRLACNFLSWGTVIHGYWQLQSAPCNTALLNLGLFVLQNRVAQSDFGEYGGNMGKACNFL